jgi:membrane associated rhomboid family serine protease
VGLESLMPAAPARRAVPLVPHGVIPQLQLFGIVAGLAYVFRRNVPKTYGLGLIMVGVFVLDFVSRLAGQGGTQQELGYSVRGIEQGAWWTPLTSIFTHAPPSGGSVFQLHIFGNLLILVAAGPALEERIGERKFLVVFFAGGFVALAAHTLLAFVVPAIVPMNALAIGASGAIFAVLSTFAIRHPKDPLPILLLFFFVTLPAFVVLLIFLGFNLVYALSDSLGGGTGIAWWGHFAGFLVGLAFAYTLPRTDPRFATVGSARGMPDPEKLAPYATTPETRRILDEVRKFGAAAQTRDDRVLAEAWLDRFFAKATCPHGHAWVRKGMSATCDAGETTVDFSRGP